MKTPTKAELKAAEKKEARYNNALKLAEYLANKNKASEILARYFVAEWDAEKGESIMKNDIELFNNLLKIEAL
tara:strand:+ start:281 stop:499 length:219 start_codon:yes stop_codon:yes gene_type:complete